MFNLTDPLRHTAEDATPAELRAGVVRLLINLLALGLVVTPLILGLPLGETSRSALLAWLLVALAVYWLYAGLGFQPLLLAQLILFSAAAAFLSAKILLVIIDVHRLSILRRTAQGLILLGAVCAVLNLGGMALTLFRRSRAPRKVS
jgi:hypothetical protein